MRRQSKSIMPTLSQKHARLVVFADDFLHGATSAIPYEYIRSSTHGHFDETKVLSSGGLMK
jgi:hypothetical protein